MRLTDAKYWNDSYKTLSFEDLNTHEVALLLNKYLADSEGKEALEIGSFPGSFLPTIGRRGFILNGVDYNLKNSTDLPLWLKTLNLKVGKFETSDFFDFIKINSKNYDLVCSFGFLEHFSNYEDVIKSHIEMVKPGGQLIITTPNFKGWMQFLPHWIFDRPNLKKHYLPSMNPGKWKKILIRNNFEIEFAGYFGGYCFWVDNMQNRNKILFYSLRFVERCISQLRKIFKFYKLESSAFSCFCGIVATKKSK